MHHLEMGALVGSDEFGPRVNFSFQTFHGLRFLPRHEFGIVVGIDEYSPLTLLPFGMGWRGWLFPEEKISAYAGLDAGFGFTALEKKEVTEWNEHRWYEGGGMFHPSLGIRLKTKKQHHWTLSLGYKRQVVSQFSGTPLSGTFPKNPDPRNTEDWNYIAKDRITFNNVVYKIGFLF
ncbi:MAG: hypothetical protein WD431_04560 [Cyclobacteriaceae bacterium]